MTLSDILTLLGGYTMQWTIEKNERDQTSLLTNESLFSLGNGYIGVRGNFEEGYSKRHQTIRGTYINAFHDEDPINYGEKLSGFPEKQQKLVNIIDAQGIDIYFDNERFSLFDGEVLHFSRKLHLDKGFSEREIHWVSPSGKEARLSFKRLASFTYKELFSIQVAIHPIKHIDEIQIVSTLEGDVTNFVDENDPRVASGHGKHLKTTDVRQVDNYNMITCETCHTQLRVNCISRTHLEDSEGQKQTTVEEDRITEKYTIKNSTPFTFNKHIVYTDTLRHHEDIISKGVTLQDKLAHISFQELISMNKNYLDDFWKKTDVSIQGDNLLQESLRFSLFQLLQSVGKDRVSNIAAKGLTGEGYEGHYFWDTEIYMFPVFLLTNPSLAKNLLLHRYSILEDAKKRAQDLGHSKGALFPWRTITGPESSAFFPAGTAQYHISADIAYSYVQYYLATKDLDFVSDYMAEVLFETARLWLDTGHFYHNNFYIDDVTGPDEYTCIVNNNYYTNVMAKYNLTWAYKIFHLLKDEQPKKLNHLINKIKLTTEEVATFMHAAEAMYLPFDDTLCINAQDDSFLRKKKWDLANTPKDHFPLLLNYHPLTLYRYQVCKQADTVLAHFLLEDEQSYETIENSYHYYESVTTHDSSLSYCVFSIMASKIGDTQKAYNYFNKTARLDLDNTHGNTKDGLHMANMGGTWMAIVYGFAGLRMKESGLSFAPKLPQNLESITFNIVYQQSILTVTIGHGKTTYYLKEGSTITFKHNSTEITLNNNEERVLN